MVRARGTERNRTLISGDDEQVVLTVGETRALTLSSDQPLHPLRIKRTGFNSGSKVNSIPAWNIGEYQ